MSNTTVRDLLEKRIIKVLSQPLEEPKDRKPKNRRWIAFLGFNLAMFMIDLISAISVSSLIMPVYGVVTFVAGFGAMLFWEQLFVNPHADKTQKNLSLAGIGLAILSTGLIGVLAGIVNVVTAFTTINVQNLEIGMILALVAITIIHGFLWGVYYFIDKDHQREMNAAKRTALRARQQQELNDAREDAQQVTVALMALQNLSPDELKRIDAAMKSNTGRSFLDLMDDDDKDGTPNVIDPDYQWKSPAPRPRTMSVPRYEPNVPISNYPPERDNGNFS